MAYAMGYSLSPLRGSRRSVSLRLAAMRGRMVSCAAIVNRRAGRLPIGPQVAFRPTCPTSPQVFHEIPRAEGPLQQTTETDRLSPSPQRHGDEHCLAFPVNQQQGRPVTGPLESVADIIDRANRLAVHLLNYVSRLNAGL